MVVHQYSIFEFDETHQKLDSGSAVTVQRTMLGARSLAHAAICAQQNSSRRRSGICALAIQARAYFLHMRPDDPSFSVQLIQGKAAEFQVPNTLKINVFSSFSHSLPKASALEDDPSSPLKDHTEDTRSSRFGGPRRILLMQSSPISRIANLPWLLQQVYTQSRISRIVTGRYS